MNYKNRFAIFAHNFKFPISSFNFIFCQRMMIADSRNQLVLHYVRVYLRRRYVFVPQHRLYSAQIRAPGQQVRCERMTQYVRADPRGTYPGKRCAFFQNLEKSVARYMARLSRAGKDVSGVGSRESGVV